MVSLPPPNPTPTSHLAQPTPTPSFPSSLFLSSPPSPFRSLQLSRFEILSLSSQLLFSRFTPCDKGGGTDAVAIGARDLVDASAAASAAVFDARAVQFGGKPLCWWSGDHGGYGWDDDASRDRRRKKRKHSGQRRGGVLMFGSGCAGCVAGQWCSFEIEIRPPAKWVFAATEAFVDFLIVELWGPSIAYADVKRIGSDSKRWKVSYRVWDAGEYTVTVISGCTNLNYTAEIRQTSRQFYFISGCTDLNYTASFANVTVISGCTNLNYTAKFAKQGVKPFANWTLTVAHPFANLPISGDSSQLPANPPLRENHGSRTEMAGKRGKAVGEVERVLAERGAGGQEGSGRGAEGGAEGGKEGGAEGEEGGDWLAEAEAEWHEAPSSGLCPIGVALLLMHCTAPHPYPSGTFLPLTTSSPTLRFFRWRFFPCASPVPPPSQWVEALAARGIREISFVGDSHQRFLMLFLNYLVMHDVDDALWKFHGDIVINIPPPKGRADLKPLKLNFYWVDGMYHNDEYGCT
ncbi:unnamed protein product [Closterium sp. NIES-64]|nr:unnamed protein product [Closterium sp. NIES-64]